MANFVCHQDTSPLTHFGENMYEDIIDKKRPDTGRHPKMAMEMRAAQFSPFAALTGLDEKMDDMAEKTRDKVLSEEFYDLPEEVE